MTETAKIPEFCDRLTKSVTVLQRSPTTISKTVKFPWVSLWYRFTLYPGITLSLSPLIGYGVMAELVGNGGS